ncbi:esterase-like activity of phytase family protein [Mycolicibacterium smegmatis]|uniref:esterase-like activity of phytase family protein n=1 Tax=Mycolicibacterium smegmatis TaxID=1772 RepID=UPI0035562478
MGMNPLFRLTRSMTAAAVMAAAAAATTPIAVADTPLEYLGQWQLPPQEAGAPNRIGGLSGITYDPAHQTYYLISDDKTEHGPVRFHTARIGLSGNGVDDVQFVGVQPLLDESGKPFGPNNFTSNPPVLAPDAEAIAYDAGRRLLYWTSEGYIHDDASGKPAILQPWIRVAGLDGAYQGEFALPPSFMFTGDQTAGPRPNGVLEGLSLTPDGRYLFAAMEQPLYQDGPATDENHTGLVRITKFDTVTRTPVAEYAYPVDRAAPETGFNGVSDILALSETSFLVIERAASLPRQVAVSVYRADTGPASDVLDVASLRDQAVTPMTKTLAADLRATPGLDRLDNIEGLTLGPRLPDGRQSVVLVSDDNFQPFEVTQFLAFALPRS